MQRYFVILCLLCSFVFVGVTSALADNDHQDFIRSEIEVYGNIKFLSRIGFNEKFSVLVYDEEVDVCAFDIAPIRESIEATLKDKDRLHSGSENADFRVDFDYFSGKDDEGHCLIAYELYLTRNLFADEEQLAYFDDKYDFENSSPILKINGVLHANIPDLDRALAQEVHEATEILLESLYDILTHLKE